jgi:hypothetical protein
MSFQQAAAQKIYLIIAADAEAKGGIGPLCKIDGENVQELFTTNVPADRLNVFEIKAEAMNEIGMSKAVEELPVAIEDTVIFYYSGHGAYDSQKEQYFQASGGNVVRTQILNLIRKKKPRLIVLLSDCCNVKQNIPEVSLSREVSAVAPVNKPQEMPPLFNSLFIYCKGEVDITSSKLGEYSGCDNRKTDNRGSCFTYPFVDLMKFNIDNGSITWTKLITELTPKVDEAFKQAYPNGIQGQMTQTLVAFNYPGKPVETSTPATTAEANKPEEKPQYRFGVKAEAATNGGLKMLEIVANSPAQKSGLEAGDIITEINGKPINTEQEYSDAVDASPKEMKVKLINVRDNKTLETVITLGW